MTDAPNPPRPTTLLIFSPGPYERGGAARRSRLIATTLAERGWEVRVIAKAGDHTRFSVSRSPNLTVFEAPRMRWPPAGAILFLACAIPLGLVWGSRSPVALAVQLVSPTTASAIWSIVLRRPFIALSTSSGELSESTYLMNSRLSWFRLRLLRRASFLGAQTDVVADELARVVDRERIHILPNPVESVSPPPLTGGCRVLYTGRLSEEKDLFGLLDAWRAVVEARPGAVLTLAGDGGHYRPVETELRRVAAQDPVLAASVRFTGWVTDVRPLLADSDVYVLPSLTEGMSNALLEACAWGRVVVASDIAPNKAVLGDDYPLLFPAGDTAALAATLGRALEDPVVRTQAVQSISQRIQTFSVDAFVAHLEELIHAATHRPRHQHRPRRRRR